MSAALALAAENAATNRRSSASSASSDLNDHGMPVVPYHDAVHNENTAVAHAHHVAKPHVPPIVITHHGSADDDDDGDHDGGPHTSFAESSRVSLASETSTIESTAVNNAMPMISLQSPKPESGGAFTFEEVMSPRHANGKRYLGGYLTHRVSMAGGFLKTWKRKYFRLRDHGILCFKQQDATTPLFEIHFKPQSLLLLDKPVTANSGGGYDDAAMLAPTRGKVNASLLIILKHIEIQGHVTPASKVDVPVYLKAENESEFHAWVENIRLKMEARKRALTQDSVNAVLQGEEQHQQQRGEDASSPTGDSVRNPSPRLTSQDRTASMSNVTPTMVVTPTADTRRPAANDPRSKVLFVAGPTPDPPEFATFRSKYLLMKEIGEGSFSIVHRAVNRVTGQLCAVKCCKYSPALEEEVAILKKLSHPNLIGLEGVYQQDDMFYVVMDYMEGGDLCERLIQKQRLAEGEAKMIVTQVLRGLEHLHRHNILHRDLKPENILLHGDVVKIADFGLARQLPSSGSMLKRSCGTLEYAAPELLCGHAYGLKSDVFSLGVVLYVLLFGAFPFTIESASALQRMERFPEGVDVRDMSCLNRDNAMWSKVSSLAQDVLLRMLSKSEKERISAKDLLLHPWFDSTRSVASLAVPAVGESTGFRRESGLRLQDMNVEERELERIRDCRAKGFVELLSRGLDLTKFAKDGHTAPHVSTIVIHFAHGTISWTARGGVLGIGAGNSTRKVNDTAAGPSAKKGARVLSFSDITEIRTGHTTEAFRAGNGREVPSAELCFSIVGTWRTLDLVVKAPSQRDFIVVGLHAALEKYRGIRK